MNCIKLTIRSPYRNKITFYLPHTLMRQFFGNNQYMTVLKSLVPPDVFIIHLGTAVDYRIYESDMTISSLLLLECLLVSRYSNNIVLSNIRQYVKKDKALARYSINYDFQKVEDIEFAVSCKLDYLDMLRKKTTLNADNIIAQYQFNSMLDRQAVN